MKKSIKKLLSLVLLLVLLAAAAAIRVGAEPVSGECGDVQWTLSDGTLTISGEGAMESNWTYTRYPWYAYADSITSVVIEDGVTNIGESAFEGYSTLTSVSIGADVTTIGNGAFSFTGLTTVNIPGSVKTIGNRAFEYCSLTSVTLNDGIQTIGMWAFMDTKLTSVVIPNSVTTLGGSAFNNCADLESVILSNRLTTIPVQAFSSCTALKHIVIPAGVTSVEQYAFGNCPGVQSITLPASVTQIGADAFGGCNTLADLYLGHTKTQWSTEVTLATDAFPSSSQYRTHYEVTDSANHWTSRVTAPTCTEEGFTTYTCKCADPYSYTADPVATRHTDENGDEICDLCNLWKEGDCGENVRWKLYADGRMVISGTGAMMDFSVENPPWIYHTISDRIETLVVENGVTNVSGQAFYGCENLTSVKLGDSVLSLDDQAFTNCTALTEIDLNQVQTVGVYTFNGCTALADITMPKVKEIGNFAFSFCAAKKITVTESLASIGQAAFSSCTPLEEITIPDSVTYMGERAFSGCEKLTALTLGSGLKEIPESAFSGTGMTSVVIPQGVTAVGKNAFAYNWSLTQVSVPASVTVLGEKAFGAAWTDLYFGGTKEAWEALDHPVAEGGYVHYNTATPKDHWKTKTVETTCTEDGYTSTTCACGYEKDREEGQPHLGHEYGEDRTCIRCPARQPVNITQEPASVKMTAGGKAKVKVTAEGDGLRYQWYIKDPGSAKFSRSSTQTSTYTVVMNAERDGRELYCVITDQYNNSVQSETVTLSMVDAVKITRQPVDTAAIKGQSLKIQIDATGDGLKYQWYYKNAGATKFSKTSTFTGDTYVINQMSADRDGRQIYCVVTDQYGNSAKTDVVTLKLSNLKITRQPVSVTVAAGKTARTKVAAEGEGISYQWYIKSPGATKFSKSSITADTYAVVMSAAKSGRQIYCVVTDKYGCSVTTDTVTVSMTQSSTLKITGQPVDMTVAAGKSARAKVVAEGEGLRYQWYVKSPGATEFSKSSITSDTYSVVMSAAKNGRQVYCVVTDSNGKSVTSNTVTLKMK